LATYVVAPARRASRRQRLSGQSFWLKEIERGGGFTGGDHVAAEELTISLGILAGTINRSIV
jgi:hypothetical protein